MTDRPEFKPGVPMRPERVKLEVPVRYRRVGEVSWHVGRSENLSRVGVLIRVVRMLPLHTHVELAMTVPAGLIAEMAGEMVLTGTVARHVPAMGSSPAMGIAFQASPGAIG